LNTGSFASSGTAEQLGEKRRDENQWGHAARNAGIWLVDLIDDEVVSLR
jgi:hypothetical protein